MKTVRLGLIGCGAPGKAHAAAVAKILQAKFVAYADAAQGYRKAKYPKNGRPRNPNEKRHTCEA
jgi:predicted dehydrogenase